MTEPTSYVDVQTYAQQTGARVADVRAMLRAGAIDGAIRIGRPGSPWAIPNPHAPRNDETPRTNAGGTPDATDPRAGDIADLTSTRVDTVNVARAVSAALSTITTRPARALTDLAYGVAIVAVRHRPDPDGRCQACRWPTFPCPDLEDLERAMSHLADQILEGTE